MNAFKNNYTFPHSCNLRKVREYNLDRETNFFTQKFLYSMKHKFPLLALILLSAFCRAQTQLPAIKFEEFADGFDQPIGIENAGDSRLFVVEKPGRIWIVDENGNKSAEPFLDISFEVRSIGSEQGLIGLVFDPDFSSNGNFYVNYTDLNSNLQISKFHSSGSSVADSTSEISILQIEHPFPNHNGGCMKFGPDGYLYIGVGDGGREGDPFNVAQNLTVPLGKILRIDVHNGNPYAIPSTNPFVDSATAVHEIWAYGLRNPWRFSFDKKLGNLWIGDVGQDSYEEVDMQKASSHGGQNYGWDCREGLHQFQAFDCPPGIKLTYPIAEYPHGSGEGEGDCTIIGGYVYRGTQFPKMKGKYIYNDYCSGNIRAIFREGNAWQNVIVGKEGAFEYVAFGQRNDGELFSADIEDGEITHVVDTSGLSPKLADVFTENLIAMSVYPNPNHGQFTVEYSASINGTAQVEITNVLGQRMISDTRSIASGTNSWSISSDHILPGTYFLVVHTDEGTARTKFSVE